MDRSIAGLLVGRTIVGRYTVEELIGRGGMSVVYRALDGRLGRPVAVKVIALPPATPDEHQVLRERLRREAASAARIPSHPNVVQVYDYGSDEELGIDFIAMELLQGRDLRSILKGGVTAPEAMRILTDSARGVAAGHRAGIVHRDVKPGNIVLVDDGPPPTVKILDFGIAKALLDTNEEDLTRTGFAPYSPAYASPEQLRPSGPLTPASDVYQLGLIGYEMLAGARPFDAEDLARLRDGEAVPLPRRGRWDEVDPSVRAVLERALQPDPASRFPDAAALANALQDGDGDETLALAATVLVDTPNPPAEAVLPPPVRVEPAPDIRAAPGTTAVRRVPRNVGLGAGLVAGLLALWLLAGRSDEAPAEGAPAIGAEDAAALEQEFRELQRQAYENLAEAASPEEGVGAAREVERVLHDLVRTWVDGDIEQHVGHYGDRVRFYGRRVPRSRVARDRAETLVRYPQRMIELRRVAVQFPEPGEAEVLLDKAWDFAGEGRSWRGEARQEITLLQEEGVWRIVGERNVEVYRSERDD